MGSGLSSKNNNKEDNNINKENNQESKENNDNNPPLPGHNQNNQHHQHHHNNHNNHNNNEQQIKTFPSIEQHTHEDFFSVKSQEMLRMNILENITLTFQRPTNIILYGCLYSKVEVVAEYLSMKLDCKILKNETSPENIHQQNLFLNYPSSFQDTLKLQKMAPNHETYAIFVYSTLSNLLASVKHKWIHKPSGRLYHTVTNPPKSMTGTSDSPKDMLDDITNEPLEQETSMEVFMNHIHEYEKVKREMWPHWIAFRHMVNGDTDDHTLHITLIHLISTIIAHQAPTLIRVRTSSGVQIRSNSNILHLPSRERK